MKQEHKNKIFEMLTKHSHMVDLEQWEINELMKELNPEQTKEKLDKGISDIVSKVEIATGVTFSEMITKSRKEKHVLARQFAMYKVRTEYRYFLPLSKVGEIFNRDHSTVLYSCKVMSNYIEVEYPEVMRILENYESAELIAA